MKKGRTQYERIFCDTVVIPYLIGKGHRIIKVNQSLTPAHFKGFKTLSPQADVSSICKGIIYITEVKMGAYSEQIQMAVGQLIFHQFVHQSQNHNGVMYQIAFPATCFCRGYFSLELTKFLHELEIDIIFLDYPII